MAHLDVEKKFLTFVMTDLKYTEVAVSKIKPEYLANKKCVLMYELFYTYYQKYLEIPTKLAFTTMLNDKFKTTPAEIEWYLIFGSQLKNTAILETDFQYVIDNIVESYMRDALIQNMNESVDSVDKKNIKEIYENLGEKLSEVVQSDNQENIKEIDVGVEWKKAYNHYDIKKKEKANGTIMGISTGLAELDKITGGWRPGELIVITGAAGEGKSAIMLNLANNAWDAGANVLFITLEMSWEEVFDRRHSLITGQPYYDIRNRNLTPEQEVEYYKQLGFAFIDEEKQMDYLSMYDAKFGTTFDMKLLEDELSNTAQKKNKFKILDISTNCNVPMVVEAVSKMMKKGGLDLVVIDYINIMSPSMKTGDNWFNYGSIARELKLLARNKKFSLLTAAQMGEVKEGQEIKAQNIKYAKMIADNADYVIGFSVSAADKVAGIIRLQMAKHRHTGAGVVTVRQQFNRMRIENFVEIG